MWRENNKAQVFFSINYHPPQPLDIFTVNLTNISGMVIVSTATINKVLHHSGTVLSCWDHAVRNLANMSTRTLTISGIIFCSCIRNNKKYYSSCRTSISTTQPHLHLLSHPLLCHHQLGSSTGHTPLCTQLHCHC